MQNTMTQGDNGKRIPMIVAIIALASCAAAALGLFISFVSLHNPADMFRVWSFWVDLLAIFLLGAAAVLTMVMLNNEYNSGTQVAIIAGAGLSVIINLILLIFTSIGIDALLGYGIIITGLLPISIYILMYIGFIVGGFSGLGLALLSLKKVMKPQNGNSTNPQTNQGFNH